MTALPRVRALALHAGYRCRRSGACCTSGWEIPIEPEGEARLRSALRSGVFGGPADGAGGRGPGEADYLLRRAGLPHGARATLGCDAHGRCLFLETSGGNRCSIQSRLGEDALPSACRHFPRVVRLTPRGIDVTLSCYCPTVAERLFAELPAAGGGADPLLQIVEAPAAFPPSWPYQGLDAREALPPLLRPGVLMSWEAHEAWEAHAVSVMGMAQAPEEALERLRADAERIRGWTPTDGDFDGFFARERPRSDAAQRGVRPALAPGATPADCSLEMWDAVAATVPPPERWRLSTPGTTGRFERGVSHPLAGWSLHAVPVCRWLAAKAFGSWLAFQGEGLRSSVLGLRLALGVLRAEAMRACANTGQPFDAALLREAMRRADLLLLHLADPESLARRLSRCERGAADPELGLD